MFSVRTSASKCVTEPAFDVGRLVASPIAKMFGAAFACSVCGSAVTNPRSSPSPSDRAMKLAPPCSGIGDEQVERRPHARRS